MKQASGLSSELATGCLSATIALMVCLSMACLSVGCEDLTPSLEDKRIAPVSGKLLDGEQPVVDAKILLIPLGDAGGASPAVWSYATTNDQGRFTMRFKPGKYGAHVGASLVVVSTATAGDAAEEDTAAENGDADDDSAPSEDTILSDQANPAPNDKQIDPNEAPEASTIDITEDKQGSARPEKIPPKFGRQSNFTFNVQPTGNSQIVFQIGNSARDEAGQ